MNDQGEQLYCMPLCIYGRKHKNKPMLRCCLCTKWYHNECVGLKADDTGVWACAYCRTLARDVTSMKETQDKMQATVSKMSEHISHLIKTIDTMSRNSQIIYEAKSKECTRLQKENTELREQLAKVTSEQSRHKWESFTQRKTLLIGDSTIRDIDQNSLRDTEVMCIPGGRIQDISNALNAKTGKYKQVTLCVGSNDCSDCAEDLNEFPTLIPKYKQVLNAAKDITAKSKDINVSSVLPRCDDDRIESLINDLNEDLSTLAAENDTNFVNHDKDFKLLSGKANDAMLLRDGVHLTQKGTHQLVKDLQLQTLSHPRGNMTKRRPAGPRSPRQNEPTSSRQIHPGHRQGNNYHQTNPRGKGHANGNARRHPQNPPRSSSFPCHFCGERNHAAHNCRHGRPLVCHTCGRGGHKSKICTENIRN